MFKINNNTAGDFEESEKEKKLESVFPGMVPVADDDLEVEEIAPYFHPNATASWKTYVNLNLPSERNGEETEIEKEFIVSLGGSIGGE